MSLTRRAFVPGLCSAFALASAFACASNAPPEDVYVAPVAPPAPVDAGCARLQTLSASGICRADWACTDAGVRVIICRSLDSGYACACTDGEQDASVAPLDADPCTDAGIAATATALCGWSVP